MIEAHKGQLAGLQKQFEGVAARLKFASGSELERLKEECDYLYGEIKCAEKRIKKAELDEQGESIDELQALLEPLYEEYSSQINASYYLALKLRQISFRLYGLGDILQRLAAAVRDSDLHPYLHRFVGFLLLPQASLPMELRIGLREWAETYIAEAWNSLQREVERDRKLHEEGKGHSCLLIKIGRSNQKSSGTSNNKYYVRAWFVEDVREYKNSSQKSVKPILLPSSEEETADPSNQIYDESALEDVVRELRQECLRQYRVPRPTIHIFLPLRLFYGDRTCVDTWPLKKDRPEGLCFGAHHRIVLRAADRLNPLEFELEEEWVNKWNALENQYPRSAADVFQDGDPSLVGTILGMGQKEEVIAVKFTQALSSLSTANQLQKVFEALLLETAIPIACWLRQEAPQRSCSEKLTKILRGICLRTNEYHLERSQCCLENLPELIRRNRIDVQESPEEVRSFHVGNHLSLLWDDPLLRPPSPAS